jgi:hypothetical protein
LRGGIDPQSWQLLATEAWLQARSF